MRPGLSFLRHSTLLLTMLAGGMVAASGAPRAADAQPVVVELFTSQGCSSCPPANANLAKLSSRPGVLALSFGVTYWDRLGWPDTFGRPEYTERQRVYEAPLGESGPFTPQIVVDGRKSAVGHDLAEVEKLIASSERRAAPALSLAETGVSIGEGPKPATEADVWLVRYDPRSVQVAVRRGENGGRTLPHTNVVHELTRLGSWSGQAAQFPITTDALGRKTAILIQGRKGGPILAATTN